MEAIGFQPAGGVDCDVSLDGERATEFFNSFYGKGAEPSDATMFHVETVTDGHSIPSSSWDGFFTNSEEKNFFIEAPKTMSPGSKDALLSLLEVAEEMNGSRVFVCVEKNHVELKALVHALLYLGFSLVTESVRADFVKSRTEDFVVLGFDLE